MAYYDSDYNKKSEWGDGVCSRASSAFSIGEGSSVRPNVARIVDTKIQVSTWRPKLYYSFSPSEVELTYADFLSRMATFEASYVGAGKYEKILLGSSTQGRNIYGYRYGPASGKHFVIDAVIHGNEHDGINGFIKAMELLYELEEFQALRDEWTLFFVPVINPDGYYLNTRNSAAVGPNGRTVNLNRNWDWFWGDYVESGAESKGSSPESEPEVQAFLSYFRTGNGGGPCNYGFLFDMHANKGPGARYQSRDRNWAQMDGSQPWPVLSGSEMEFDFQIHVWKIANALQTIRVREEGMPDNFTRLYHSRFNPHLHSYFSSQGCPSMISEDVKVPFANGNETYQSACNFRLDYILAAAAVCTSSWWEEESGAHIEPAGTNLLTNAAWNDWSSTRDTPQFWNQSRGNYVRRFHRYGQEEDSGRFYQMGERASFETDLAADLDTPSEWTRVATADNRTTGEYYQALVVTPASGNVFHINLNGTSGVVGALTTHAECVGCAVGYAADNTIHVLGGGTAAPSTGAVDKTTIFTTVGTGGPTGDLLNTARMFMAYCDNYLGFPTAGVDERVWLFGGYDNGGSRLTSIEEWNPNVPITALKVAVLPAALADASAAYYPPTGKIYIFGGSTNGSPTGVTDILEYDPVLDSIAAHGTSMSVALRHAAVSYCPGNGKIYIIGGQKADDSMSDVVYSFDPATSAYIEEEDLKQDLDDEDEQDGSLREWDVAIGRNSAVTIIEAPGDYGEIFMPGGRLVNSGGSLTDTVYLFTPDDSVIGRASDVNYGYVRFNTKLDDTSWADVLVDDFTAGGLANWTDPNSAWQNPGGKAQSIAPSNGPLIVTTGPSKPMTRFTVDVQLSAAAAPDDFGISLRSTFSGGSITDGYRLRYSDNGGTPTWYIERYIGSASTTLDSIDVSGDATSQPTTSYRSLVFEVGSADQAAHLKATFNGNTLFSGYFDVHADRILTAGDAAFFARNTLGPQVEIDNVQVEEADWNSGKWASSIMVKTESPTSGGYVRQNLATGDDSSPVTDLTVRRVRNYYTIPPNNRWIYYRATCDGASDYYAYRTDGLRFYERLYKDGQSIEMQGPCLVKDSLIPIAYCHPDEPKAAETLEFSSSVHMNSFWCKLKWTPWHAFTSVGGDMEIARWYIDATNYIVLEQLASNGTEREYNIRDIYNVHEPTFRLKKVRAGGTEETCTVVCYYGYTLTGTAQDWIVHDTIEFDVYHMAGGAFGMNVRRGALEGYSTAVDSGVVAFSGTTGSLLLSGYGFHATPEVKNTVDATSLRISGPGRTKLPTGRTDLMRRLLTAADRNVVLCGERDPTNGLINPDEALPYASDDFDRADDPNLGDKWFVVKQTGNGWNIVSNKAQCTQEGWERWWGIPKHRDVIVSAHAAVYNNNDLVGLGTRFVYTTLSDVTCYGAELLQTGAAAATLRLVLWFEGARTILGTDALSSYSQGTEYLLRITTSGTNLTAEVLNLAGDTTYATVAVSNDILQKPGRITIYGETGGATQAVTLDNFNVEKNFTDGVL